MCVCVCVFVCVCLCVSVCVGRVEGRNVSRPDFPPSLSPSSSSLPLLLSLRRNATALSGFRQDSVSFLSGFCQHLSAFCQQSALPLPSANVARMSFRNPRQPFSLSPFLSLFLSLSFLRSFRPYGCSNAGMRRNTSHTLHLQPYGRRCAVCAATAAM